MNRVTKAIKNAIETPYYVLKYNPNPNSECVWEIHRLGVGGWYERFEHHYHAENRCEALQHEYIARKAVEALKETDDRLRNEYFEMAKAEGWNNNNACFQDAIWNRSIDAILTYDMPTTQN